MSVITMNTEELALSLNPDMPQEQYLKRMRRYSKLAKKIYEGKLKPKNVKVENVGSPKNRKYEFIFWNDEKIKSHRTKMVEELER